MGRQNVGALIYVFAYYVVGMPLGIWWAYDELPFYGSGPLKIRGLWMGAAVSAAIGSVFFLFFRLWVDWNKVLCFS